MRIFHLDAFSGRLFTSRPLIAYFNIFQHLNVPISMFCTIKSACRIFFLFLNWNFNWISTSGVALFEWTFHTCCKFFLSPIYPDRQVGAFWHQNWSLEAKSTTLLLHLSQFEWVISTVPILLALFFIRASSCFVGNTDSHLSQMTCTVLFV